MLPNWADYEFPEPERREREAVIQEAISWLGTPFHHEARVKRGGVDCAMFLAEVYHACNLVPPVNPSHYPPDWHLHRNEEKYLAWADRFALPVKSPLPADAMLFRMGRCFSHGGIVLAWPWIIHAFFGQGVEYCNLANSPALMGRPHIFYRPKQWRQEREAA